MNIRASLFLGYFATTGLVAAGCSGSGISRTPTAEDMASGGDMATGGNQTGSDMRVDMTSTDNHDMTAGFSPFSIGSTKNTVLAAPFSFISAPVLADMNGDGKIDITARVSFVPGDAGVATQGFAVLPGNGDGTFGTPITTMDPNSLGGLAVGDFNGDGKQDVVVTVGEVISSMTGGSTIEMLLGKGDGTFQTAVPYGVIPNGEPQEIIAIDLNKDGKLDVATADFGVDTATARTSILLGKGDGTLGAYTSYQTGQFTFSMGAGDFLGNGSVDLVTAGLTEDALSILTGKGDGTFTATNLSDSGPYALATADFDGDGKTDIVVSDSGGITIRLSNGQGDFTMQQPALSTQPAPTSTSQQYIRTGDLDNDGHPDIVTAQQTNVSFYVIDGNPAAGSASQVTTAASPGDATGLALGDVNGDGKLDIVVTNGTSITTTLQP